MYNSVLIGPGGGTGFVVVDNDVLIAAIERGRGAVVDAAIAGLSPVVANRTAVEFSYMGDPNALVDWLNARGGHFIRSGSDADVARLQAEAASLGRTIGYGDAKLVGAAQREGLPVLTADRRLYRFLQAAGYPSELLPG